ncbi:MAG: DUF948 domain-containing protein [Carnobacterium sp.]|nr:DUF948 domain-containing protein [Carnobacterium sp.]
MTGGIIALIIAVLALIVLTVFGLIVLKKVSRLMKEINKTTVTAQDKIDFFTKDTDAITAKLNYITQRVNGLSTELSIKMEKINYFSETTADFQDALDELKNSIQSFFSGFFNFSNKKSPQHPSSITILKETVKKLVEKRKTA